RNNKPARLARPDESRLHPERTVVRHAAIQPVRPGEQLELSIDRLAGLSRGQRIDARPTDPPQPEVVCVLAAVPQLDDRPAGLDRLPRHRVAELLRDDLDARRWESGGDHLTSVVREKDVASGITRPASTPSHCSRSDA